MTSTILAHIALAKTHRHEALVERRRAIEHRRRHADAVGEVADHVEIVLQTGHGALRRQEAALRHPRRADAELGRAAAAGGDRLDHQRHVDAGLEPERHRFRGRRDVDRDQKIVDELDPARGAERAEIEAGIGKAATPRFDRLACRGIAGEIDHALARRHHARRARHFAVDEGRAFLLKRRDLALLDRNRMRAELDDDLSRPRRMDQALARLAPHRRALRTRAGRRTRCRPARRPRPANAPARRRSFRIRRASCADSRRRGGRS